MLKYLVALLILAALLGGGFFAVNEYNNSKLGGVEDIKDATFTVDGRQVTMVNGEGITDIGNGAKTYTSFFGNEARGDLNDDGREDVAFLVSQSGSGSGTFYYAVAALKNAAGRYEGTNAVFLGDRVAPQTTEIRNGILIVNYADRKPGEPMAARPSVGVSAYIYYDGEKMIAVPPAGPIAVEGITVCLPHRDQEGPQTLECAFGLLDDRGRYFALSDTDPEYKNVAGVPMNVRVRVEGTFKLRLGSNYVDIGVIEVTKIEQLND